MNFCREYGRILDHYEDYKLLLGVDTESKGIILLLYLFYLIHCVLKLLFVDASELMAKALAKIDKELPKGIKLYIIIIIVIIISFYNKGKPFALGNDLKRLANCPNPEIVPDLERPRYEALKALFPMRECITFHPLTIIILYFLFFIKSENILIGDI